MTNWQTKKIGGIATVKRGGSPRPIQDYLVANDAEGYNWLKIGDVPAGSRYIYKTSAKIKSEGLNKTTLVRKGDFILSNSMSFGRPYIMMTDACIHDGWLTLQEIDESIDKNFLYYLLISEQMQNKFKNHSAGSGVQNLKKETVQDIDFSAPEKPEQERIVAVLQVWDEYIEKLEQKIALEEQTKSSLMSRYFVPASKSVTLEKMLISFSTGLNPRQNFSLGHGNNSYVTIKNISRGKLNLRKVEKVDDSAIKMIARRSRLAKNDVIMSSIGNVGEAYLLRSEPIGWNINESVFALKPNLEKILPEYLYYFVTSNFARRFFDNHITGSSFKSIKMKDLKEMPMNQIDIHTQQEVVDILGCLDKEIDLLHEKLDNIKQQKKYLLKNLISGTILMPEDLIPLAQTGAQS